MTPKERKLLETKREQLDLDRMTAIAKANQAQGAIAMLDSILALPDEPEAPVANGNAEHHANG